MARDRQLNLRVTAEERQWYDEYRSSGMTVEQAVVALMQARSRIADGPARVVASSEPVVTKIEKDKVTVTRATGVCPHRVPRGTFCKRCATGGS